MCTEKHETSKVRREKSNVKRVIIVVKYYLILCNYRATLKEIINILGVIMEKSATLHSRIDKKTKDSAEKILAAIGINHSEAINLFYRQIVLRRGIPFSLEIPNEETLKAIKELESGKKVKSFKTVKKLFADLDN